MPNMALLGGQVSKDKYVNFGIFGNWKELCGSFWLDNLVDNFEEIFGLELLHMAGHLRGYLSKYFVFRPKYAILRIKIIVGN